jgi:hypothetical protein
LRGTLELRLQDRPAFVKVKGPASAGRRVVALLEPDPSRVSPRPTSNN